MTIIVETVKYFQILHIASRQLTVFIISKRYKCV